MRWMLALLLALSLLAAACGGEPTAADGATDEGADAIEVGATDATSDDPTPEDASDDAADDDGSATDDAGADDPASGEVIDVRTDADVTATPGRWAVGEAGTVEWDLADDGLVLVDVTTNDGWTSSVDVEDSDEIEVDFRRENTDIEFEVELDDGRVEVDIKTDITPADQGAYELGQAGSFEFAADTGQLALVDVVVADGWQHQTTEEDGEEIEFHVTRDDQRWDVEIELDDGRVELEIDYRVRGTR